MIQQLELISFLALAGVTVIAALGVVFSRSAVYSVLSLLVNFGALAVLYLMLNAQFVAAVQILVYAGAIVVLFLFVQMLLGTGDQMEPVHLFDRRTVPAVAARGERPRRTTSPRLGKPRLSALSCSPTICWPSNSRLC